MGFSFSNFFFYRRGPRTPAHGNARRGPQHPPHFPPGPRGVPLRLALTPGKCLLLPRQFDRLWSEMPINAKGRLRYPDFLSRFGSEKAATPPATGDSAKAHRGSSVPEVSDGNRSAGSSPTRDPRAGTRQRSHPCVSPPPLGAACRPGPGPQVPLGVEPSRSHGQWVTEKVAPCEPGAGVPGEEPPGRGGGIRSPRSDTERPNFEPRPTLAQGRAAGLASGAGPPRGALASSPRPACLGGLPGGS